MIDSARTRPALVLVAALVLLGGCGDDSAEPETDGTDGAPATFTVGPTADPVESEGLVWSIDTVVHLSDGTEIDLGEVPQRYAVGGDGVFFTSTDGGPEETAVASHPLLFADRDGEVTEVAAGSLDPFTSPDGRFLVYLDLSSGERDQFGAPQLQTVVVDLITGEEVVRTTEGGGDPSSDDFASLYSENEIGIERVTDQTAYVDVGPALEIDLETGDVSETDGSSLEWLVEPGDPVSPEGEWTVVQTADLRDVVRGPEGRRFVPDPPTDHWTLGFWADDDTVMGTAIDGPVGGPDDPFTRANAFTLFSCEVPDGACTLVPETTGATVRFQTGEFVSESTVFAPTQG